MKTGTVARREPTGFDAALGASTLLVGLVDAVMLLLMVAGAAATPGWGSVAVVAGYSGYLVAVLVLGLLTSAGIVLRSMGATGGLAAKWLPLAFVGARLGLFVLVFVLAAANGTAWLEWAGWELMAFVTYPGSPYFAPTTLLLLILALLNLKARRDGGHDPND
jgi:hypothetical protein